MRFRKKRPEKEEEKFELSNLSKALLIVVLLSSIILVKIPLAFSFLMAFLILSTTFDIYNQQEERKRRDN